MTNLFSRIKRMFCSHRTVTVTTDLVGTVAGGYVERTATCADCGKTRPVLVRLPYTTTCRLLDMAHALGDGERKRI